jgi:lipopolysaccharide transport protein LptA
VASSAGISPRVAVAPFSLDGSLAGSELDLAEALAQRLAARPLERVVSPSELGVAVDARPPASLIRDWAARARVNTVVVGRAGRAENGRVEAWIETRSGHSGAADKRYRIEPRLDQNLDQEVERLASVILADLGYEEPAQDSLPAVGAAAGAEPGEIRDEEDEDSLLGGLRSDDPISIESEEIEVVDREGLRHLVFRGGVKVVQGEITLKTDHLEAFYTEGASRPDRLEAEGNVRVSRRDRRARCEHATYLREEQVIVCRGQAEVYRDCDRVRGREIHFNLDRDSVRVVGAASVVIQAKNQCPAGAR